MSEKISRRDVLKLSGAVMAASFVPACNPVEEPGSSEGKSGFRYCFNTSTIRGQGLSLVQEIEIAARAGFDAVEPWIREISAHVDQGSALEELRDRIADLGLTVESGIGFAQWIVDDDEARAKGLEEAKRDMELLARIGGKRIAAPPAGAVRGPGLDLLKAAERYRALLDLGKEFGIVPQIEIWGFADNLNRLGEAALVAIESGHPDACMLPDIYHIHKGGSDFAGLKMFGAKAIQVFHINDYPGEISRAELADKHRVYPGDGAADLTTILRDLHAVNPEMVLSLELFNESYWQQDAVVVAQTGLAKMKGAVEAALS
jgi:sugar phosphate isomerase/epimerase